MDEVSYKAQSEKLTKEKNRKKFNCYFRRYHWTDGIRQEMYWLLFQSVLSFTANIMPEYSDYSLLQSMLRVVYLFQVQFKFDNDEITDVFIQCNHCKKIVTCQFYETLTIDILPVFIKTVVFCHVCLLFMIETKD